MDIKRTKQEMKTRITKHVKAQIELAWKGAGDPADIPAIEERAKRAKKNVDSFVDWIFRELEGSRK